MSISQDIRGALQENALATTGLPADVAYEGVTFQPAVGTPYVRMTVIPVERRPYSVPADTIQDRGIFQIDLNYPIGSGTGSAEAAADSVIADFSPANPLTHGSARVFIEYAERTAAMMIDPEWIKVVISIGWRAFIAP